VPDLYQSGSVFRAWRLLGCCCGRCTNSSACGGSSTGDWKSVSESGHHCAGTYDTLLQSFHGPLLQFQTVFQILPQGEAKQKYDSAIDQGAEGSLRAGMPCRGCNNLAVAIRSVGKDVSVYAMTEKQLTQQFSQQAGTPDALACRACVNVQNLWALN
jgi:hypothetical protein